MRDERNYLQAVRREHSFINTDKAARREEVVDYTSERKAAVSSAAFGRAETWSERCGKALQKGGGNTLGVYNLVSATAAAGAERATALRQQEEKNWSPIRSLTIACLARTFRSFSGGPVLVCLHHSKGSHRIVES